MFPFLQTGHPLDLPQSSKSVEPSRRIDVQREFLEHEKMYHLNTMAVEQSFANRDRELAARRQVELAMMGKTTLVTRLRLSLASFMISTGQRIRPEAPLGEPRYHG